MRGWGGGGGCRRHNPPHSLSGRQTAPEESFHTKIEKKQNCPKACENQVKYVAGDRLAVVSVPHTFIFITAFWCPVRPNQASFITGVHLL